MSEPVVPDYPETVCTWPVSYASCGTCVPLDGMEEAEKAAFEQMATEYLWNWTGRSIGTCPAVVRPCGSRCSDYVSTFEGRGPYGHVGTWSPVLVGGSWYNIRCGSCGYDCRCDGGAASLMLPGPIASVEQVTIDGVVLAPENYRVDNHRFLVRTDGERWPVCQDMSMPVTEPDTFEVQYSQGSAVPIGGMLAAGVLACELAKAACRDGSCQLPQRIQSITRQGVTVAVLDSFDDIDTGHTGIWVIDSWVASVTKPRRRGRVYSPDIPRPAMRSTSWPVT